VREIWLRPVFAFGLAWAEFFLLAEPMARDKEPGPGIELSVGLGLAALAGLSVWAVGRWWPGFLRIPPSLPWHSSFVRFVLCLPAAYLLLAVLFGGIEWLHLRRTGDPAHSQYGVSVLLAALWYPSAFAPLVASLGAWLLSRRAGRREAVPPPAGDVE
jgi:hypothetical protein